jgi:WD40 repeat protein
MAARSKLLMLSLTLALVGCATTPQIQLSTSDMAMEVKSKVSPVTAVDYSPDGKSVASGGLNGTVRLWDIAGAKEAMKFKVNPELITDVAYSPDGKTIAVASGGVTNFSEDVTTLWDIATGSQIKTFTGNFGGNLSFSSDGKFLLGQTGGFGGGTIKYLDIQSGSVAKEFKGETGIISPNGKYLANWGMETKGSFMFPTFDFHVTLSDLATSSRVWRKSENVGAAIFSPDSQRLLVALGEKKDMGADLKISFKLFDVVTGAQLNEFGHVTIPGGIFSIEYVHHLVKALDFSPDGKYFLSGNLGGQYKLWDVATGTVVRQLKTADETAGTIMNTAPSVRFSPDGKTVVIASLASTRLYDVSTGNELATMIAFDDGEWLITTPNGYYNSSEKGDQYLNVTVGGKPYSISQLRESFYRPDLVKVALAGQTLTGLKKVADIKPPPGVEIVETPTSVGSDETIVKVKVADQGGGVGDVRLYLNGSAVVSDRTRNLAVAVVAGKAQVFSYKVRLVSGKNALRAIAFNAENSMQSTDALHVIEASIAAKKPSLHALIIGIQEYDNPKLMLKYPVADAKLMAATLRERASGLFEGVNVVELTTKTQTTKDAINRTLKEMSGKVRPDDLFVFFVASHGTVDDGQYFLLTSNVGATSTHILKQTALSQDDLKALIANVPATKKLVLIDTCNAGKLGEAIQVAMLTRGMNEDTALKVLSRAVGSTILSASNSVQEALEGYKNHGLFTWVVAEGLKGSADSDRDGYVKTHELVNYVDSQVPELAEKVFKHKQYPTTTLSGQGFPVVRVR